MEEGGAEQKEEATTIATLPVAANADHCGEASTVAIKIDDKIMK